jgi:hypothetical protein
MSLGPLVCGANKKSWGYSWGKQLPGERSREIAETRHTSPQSSRYVRRKGAAPLSGAEELTVRAVGAYAQYTFLLSLKKDHEVD